MEKEGEGWSRRESERRGGAKLFQRRGKSLRLLEGPPRWGVPGSGKSLCFRREGEGAEREGSFHGARKRAEGEKKVPRREDFVGKKRDFGEAGKPKKKPLGFVVGGTVERKSPSRFDFFLRLI